MVLWVKTTLNLDDGLMARLKAAAARRRTTMSALVETALRRFLREKALDRTQLPELPSFDGGGAFVDAADREALYRAMEGR